MKLALLVATLLALAAPTALADDECPFERTYIAVAPELHVAVEIEERDCENVDSVMIAVSDTSGRTTLEWYDDERGQGLEVFRPPYFVSWTDTDQGCTMIVYVFALGAIEHACIAGAPPEPVHVPL